MERCTKDLLDFKNKGKGTKFNFNLHKFMMLQIIEGVAECHRNDVMHRDLKPENILVKLSKCPELPGELPIVKISDFGASIHMNIPTKKQSNCIGTRTWRPPEQFVYPLPYSFPADVWALGCICAFICTKQGTNLIEDPFNDKDIVTEKDETYE